MLLRFRQVLQLFCTLIVFAGGVAWVGRAAADDAPARPAGEKASLAQSAEDAIAATPDAKAKKQHVEVLIRQLGSPQYTARRAAANELRQIGAEAFDQLHAATADKDPEVAASAHYLLRQVTVRWTQSGDTAAVRSILRQYGEHSEERRARFVATLAGLSNGEGLAALCRITRFDRSPLVSRRAAMAIIQPDDELADRPSIDPDVVNQELQSSTRPGARWVRQFLVQLRDPAASVAAWQKLLDEEIATLRTNTEETSSEIVSDLLWNVADVHRQLGNTQELFETMRRMVELDGESLEATSIKILAWITEHRLWDTLEQFLDSYQTRLQSSKRPLYYAALALAAQGKAESAQELAKQASELDPQGSLESFLTARDLEEHKQFEWAVREYHLAIDKQPVESQEAMIARVYLANLLHDYEQHQRAAEALDPLVKAVHGEGRVGQLYTEIQRRGIGLVLPKSESLAARLHYYRACQYREEQDWKRMRDELELAIRFDPTDADVVIAMYRLPEADENWREATRRRIRNLAQQFQLDIDEDPSDPTPYNQWAWLISNTEGDYQKAIRYSHRSLELIPPGAGESAGASFLDTLGRCYYAAGDYENALKYQRQAVAKVDYMQVMQRQLALFEGTLAEQGKAAPSSSSEN